VFVLDLDAKKIFEFHLDGSPVLDEHGTPIAAAWNGLQQPMGLAVDATHLWVGDNALRRVLQFDRAGSGFVFAGEAVGYQGPVAALACDTEKGLLWVAGGTAVPPVALSLGAGFGARGALWSERISIGGPAPKWHRLHASVAPGDSEAHVRFFVRTSNDPAAPSVDLNADPPFPASEWRSFTYDVSDGFLGGPPQHYLWVAALLLGDRKSTPAITQMRVEYDHQSYLSYLPEIYREDSGCADFLLRFLSLFESFFDEPETVLAALPRLFDPASAPAEILPWLATWLALDLPGDLTEKQRRIAIAKAFERYALRGTARGLQQAIEDSTGVQAVIEEPILNASWWRLPAPSSACNDTPCQVPADAPRVWQDGGNSILGFSTGLASAAPQGAVIGSTSVLDQAHLITQNELGAPLFEAVAYQFSVLVYSGEIQCGGKLAAVQAVVENEKPAHTLYHLCVVEPQMRVGFQSRLGIDTVVAGPAGPSRLGVADTATPALVLAGEPPGSIGHSRVGESTRL
jgi:phage tail-like protein